MNAPSIVVTDEMIGPSRPDVVEMALQRMAAAQHEREIAEFVAATGCPESVARVLLMPIAGGLW